MCFKDFVITTVVCQLTRSFTVAVGVEVAGVLPLVVVFCLVYNYMPFMGVLCFLIVFSVFLFRQAARCVRKAMPENLVKLVFVLSGFKSQRINANQVGDSLPLLDRSKKKEYDRVVCVHVALKRDGCSLEVHDHSIDGCFAEQRVQDLHRQYE
jgi:hypothetical protein